MHRVYIVADIRIYREGLAETLGRTSALTVVGTAAASDEALVQVSSAGADVVLVDRAMPGSLDFIRRLLSRSPDTNVVVLGVAETADVLTCAEAGIAGYVPREASLAELVAAVESAARGEALCSPVVAATLLRRVAALAAGQTGRAAPVRLTARESQITRLIDQGYSNKEIAVALSIEVATVKNHVHNILEKLQVHRRGEAAARIRTAAAPRGASGG